MDLANTFEEAGGIGGLLIFADHVPATDTYHYVAYDGNGNVTGLVQSSGAPSALYEYSPFGERLRVTGPASSLNPFQFSTKYLDPETGLSYYGHRYYSPTLGRWLNRDPIEEEDGPNVYCFVRNSAVHLVDDNGCRVKDLLRAIGTAVQIALNALFGQGDAGGIGEYQQKKIELQEILEQAKPNQPGKPPTEPKPKKPKAGSGKPYPPERLGTTRSLVSRVKGRGGIIRLHGTGAWRSLPAIGVMGALANSAVAASMGDNLISGFKNLHVGNTAEASLDLISAAIDFQTLGGDYFSTYILLDSLLEAEATAK